MGTTTSLRQEKKARTRDALVRAAWELFREHGFEATTIDEIAAHADVSRRTFFRYFATKEAVVFPYHEEQLGLFRQLLSSGEPDEGPYAKVRRASYAVADHFMARRQEMLEQSEVVEASPRLIAYDIQLDQKWEDAICEALSVNGSATHARQDRIEAAAIMGMMRAVVREWLDGGVTGDLRAGGAEGFDFLAAGVGRRTS